ncbi:MAG: hypothetical protein ACRDTD_21065, partial [Pseudonocardiaceae bacterium]
ALLRDIGRTLTAGTAAECQALAGRLGDPGGGNSEYDAGYRAGHDEGAAARTEVMTQGLIGMDASALIVERSRTGARSPAATAGYRDGFFTGSNPIGPASIADAPDGSPLGMTRLRAGFWRAVAEQSGRLPSADSPGLAARARISEATGGPTVAAFGSIFPAELTMSTGAPPALRVMGALAVAIDWLGDRARVAHAIEAGWVSEAHVAQARDYVAQQLAGPPQLGGHILSFEPPSAERPLRITGVSRTSVDHDDVDALHVLVLNSRFNPVGTAGACEELKQTVNTRSACVWCVASNNDFGGGRLLEEMAAVSNRVGPTTAQDDHRVVLAVGEPALRQADQLLSRYDRRPFRGRTIAAVGTPEAPLDRRTQPPHTVYIPGVADDDHPLGDQTSITRMVGRILDEIPPEGRLAPRPGPPIRPPARARDRRGGLAT